VHFNIDKVKLYVLNKTSALNAFIAVQCTASVLLK